MEQSYRFGFHRVGSVLLVSALVGVLLYLDLRARKESLTMETLRTDLQASAPDPELPESEEVGHQGGP